MSDRNPEPDLEAVQEIFADVCDVPLDQRVAMVSDRCGGDTRLRTAVIELLTASDRAGRFMSDPVAGVARIAASESVAAELPSQIGEFKVIRLLGEGGFGSVYLAEQAHRCGARSRSR